MLASHETFNTLDLGNKGIDLFFKYPSLIFCLLFDLFQLIGVSGLGGTVGIGFHGELTRQALLLNINHISL